MMHTDIIQKLKTFYEANKLALQDAEVEGYLLDAIADAEYAQIVLQEEMFNDGIMQPFNPQAEWGVFNKRMTGVK